MSNKLNAIKTTSTQAIIDSLKVVNFSKLAQVIFANTHSSCPDHNGQPFVYKGISALNLCIQPYAKGNESGLLLACTAKQWRYVPKVHPVMNVRLNKAKNEVYAVPLYAYATESFSVEVALPKTPVLTGLNKAEVDFVWDYLSWRLGEEPSSHNHRLGFTKIHELSALADSFLDFKISKTK